MQVQPARHTRQGLVLCFFSSGDGSYLFSANGAPLAGLSHAVGLNPPMAAEAAPDVFCGQVRIRDERQ